LPVNTPHREYSARSDQWSRCRDCYEGSDTVKSRGVKYLPQLDSHTRPGGNLKYDEYKKRALYYNATGRTTDGLSGMVFQRPPVYDVPTLLEEHLKDVTMAGQPADLFALRALRETLLMGRFGVLVDMTADEVEPGQEVRPYWIGIKAEDIISWQTIRFAGDEVLIRVVLCEYAEVIDPEDPFKLDYIQQYRVLALINGTYMTQIWREEKPGSDRWMPFPAITPLRRGKALPFIPFTFIGPTSTSAEVPKPPMLDLADLNLSHYRTMADLEHGRHLVALPTPWVSGVRDNSSAPLGLGPGTVWVLDREGRAGMLEFTGQGLAALVTAEADKRKMMATLGARLLEDVPKVEETLGAVALRRSGEHASLKTVAQTVSQALSYVCQIHGYWLGAQAKLEDVKALVKLNTDFLTQKMSGDEMRSWIQAMQAGAVSFETMYAAFERGELTRPGVTAEQEKALIDEEQAHLAALEEERLRSTNPELFEDPPSDPVPAPQPRNPPRRGPAAGSRRSER
jgi:hypothetical protein